MQKAKLRTLEGSRTQKFMTTWMSNIHLLYKFSFSYNNQQLNQMQVPSSNIAQCYINNHHHNGATNANLMVQCTLYNHKI